jgi:hypothetical protein
MSAFRKYYRSDSFGFKQIDKFLWTHGAEPDAAASAGAQI